MKQHIPVTKGTTERDAREASFTYQLHKGVGMQQIERALAQMKQQSNPKPRRK